MESELPAMRRIIDNHRTQGAQCARECTHCCQIGGPEIPAAEAVSILNEIPADVFEAAVKRLDGNPCPFLESDCTIYEHRPLACRAYRSRDRAECERHPGFPKRPSILDQELLVLGELLARQLGPQPGQWRDHL